MFQMREQHKTSENELNETEISNLPDTEFKSNYPKMLIKLRKRMDKHSKNLKSWKILEK